MCIEENSLYNVIYSNRVDQLNWTNNIVFNNDNIDLLNILSERSKPFIDIGILDPPYNTKRKDLKYPDDNPTWDSDFKARVEKIYKLLRLEGFIVITLNDIKLSEAIQITKNIFGSENTFIFTYNTDTGGDVKGRAQDLKSVIEFGIIGIKNISISKFQAPLISAEIYKYPNHYRHLVVFNDSNDIIKFGEHKSISRDQKNNISFLVNNFKFIYCDTNSDGGIHANIKNQLEIYFKKNLKNFIVSNNFSFYLKYLTTPLKITITETNRNNISNKNKFIVDFNEKFYLINLRLLVPISTSYYILEDKIFKKSKLSTHWNDISYNGISSELPEKLNNSMKPVKLFERIISLYSSEANNNITVFDAYSGRGTVAKAIYNINNNQNNITYNFITCEENNSIFSNILYPNISSLPNIISNCEFYKIKFT